MDTRPSVPRIPRKLTLLLRALRGVQSLTGVLAPGHYRDAAWIRAAWFGNDWLTLVVGRRTADRSQQQEHAADDRLREPAVPE